MDASSEAAEQIVRMTLEGTEVALRITGAGAKNAAAMLLAAAASNEKTKGRARLSAMLKSGRELRVFPIRFDDLKGFAKEARRYGIAYAVVKQKDGESVDLLVRAEDASKVNRIAERLGLCRTGKIWKRCSASRPGGFAGGPPAFTFAESRRCGGPINYEGGLNVPLHASPAWPRGLILLF